METQTRKKNPLISSKNAKKFFRERNKLAKEISFQIFEISGRKAETIDSKTHNISISKTARKKKSKKLEVELSKHKGTTKFVAGKKSKPDIN